MPPVDAPPIHFAPIAELLRDEPEPAELDLRLLNKSNRVNALDLRFQRYRKAEP